MTNIDESTTNDPDNEEQHPAETPTPSDYFDDLEQKKILLFTQTKKCQTQKIDSLEIARQHLHANVQGEKYLCLRKEGGLNYRQGVLEE